MCIDEHNYPYIPSSKQLIVPKNVHKQRFSIKSFVQIYVVTFSEQGNVCVTLGTSHFVNI